MNPQLQQAFLAQAKGSAVLGSAFMDQLMQVLATPWPARSVVGDRLEAMADNMDSDAARLPLRLAGGLHALVLGGQVPGLAQVYPPHQTTDAQLREAVMDAIHDHGAALCAFLDSPPQTNEVRRSAVLIAVAHWLTARFDLPLVLSELGASAGLNLLFDRYALDIGPSRWGPTDAAIALRPDWRGAPPPLATPQIVERRGVDLNPLHVGQATDALRLLSYFWPDQPDRMARTRAAMALPQADIDKGDAADWLETRLGGDFGGQVHLLFHNIAFQYFPTATKERIRQLMETAGRLATARAPLAWFGMESDATDSGTLLTLRLWPGDLQLNLGQAGFHGEWVAWRA